MRDIKELVGMLIAVTGDAEVTEQEVLDLEFDAEGELLHVLNAAYIGLLEFVHDRELRAKDRDLDGKERAALRQSLNTIIRLCDIEGSRA
jgi:hypothetical protein